jgi:putative ABC transport system substrate-binding protein
LEFKTGNAEGDINLQRSIITQMRDADYDLIVPVATSVTQMTASLVHSQPILGLAADIKDKQNHLVIVDDEIDKEQIIAFIQKVDPKLKHLVLVHSSLDKIFSEVAQVEKACNSHHIVLRRFMIQSLADLYSVTQAMPSDAQAVFILKDSLVASGIDSLVQEAKRRKIPLITSDDGTVKKGASFALGVHEKDIGIEGAKLAAKILHGESPEKLATVKLTRPSVFVNSKTLTGADQFFAIKLAAKQLHYPFEAIQ